VRSRPERWRCGSPRIDCAGAIESPAPGGRSGSAEQAGAPFTWREDIGGTPNPAFRKIEISVADASAPDHVLVRLVGYLGQR
jgi:hypothetical protein